jgi:hypothetical protein
MGASSSSTATATATATATDGETASPPRVALVGDSTIDNVIWVAEGCDIPTLLRRETRGAFQIDNLAADGFTTAAVLRGGQTALSFAARQRCGDPFPGGSAARKRFAPLEVLRSQGGCRHCLLSVGGNDIREVLGRPAAIPAAAAQLVANYLAIMEAMGSISETPPVLMLQYRPCRASDHRYRVYAAMSTLPGPGTPLDKLHALMERLYAPIIQAARRARSPVIDLPSSFDCDDASLFECQIEPSAVGGARIAAIIAHVLRSHDFSGPSAIYVQRGGEVSSRPNDGTWAVSPPPRSESQSPPPAPPAVGATAVAAPAADSSALDAAMLQLEAMGFTDRATLGGLLTKHGGDVDAVVADLLADADGAAE